MTCETTDPSDPTYWPRTSLSEWPTGKPSKDHVTDGVGLPPAMHFNDTAGPGFNVCSMNLYLKTGGVSENCLSKAYYDYMIYEEFLENTINLIIF